MELEEEMETYFKDLLECPVCFETIDSVPIYQCQNGHVVCKNCQPKLKTCPICRVDVSKKSKPIRNLKLEKMVEKLQLSLSEGTKKLASESIQIDPILPETPNVCRDTNLLIRQANVQSNIVEDDENVTSEPCSCFDFFVGLVSCSIIGGGFFGIGYLFYLGTLVSVISGFILLVIIFKLFGCLCLTCK